MRKIVFIILSLSSVLPSLADTYVVDHNGFKDFNSIQAAINYSLDDDTIIVNPGIYYENIDFRGRAITLTSIDPNDPDVVESTVIDAKHDDIYDIVVSFHTGEGPNSVIAGFKITGGYAQYGSGICCWENCSPTIKDCNITGNTSTSDGGGIYCRNNSNPIITDCNINKNSSTNYSGGEYTAIKAVRLLGTAI